MTTTKEATDGSNNYVEVQLPPHLVEKLEAGAFRSLCSHLKERSDAVQNIDLMAVSGFCRNCLAKVSIVLVSCVFCMVVYFSHLLLSLS